METGTSVAIENLLIYPSESISQQDITGDVSVNKKWHPIHSNDVGSLVTMVTVKSGLGGLPFYEGLNDILSQKVFDCVCGFCSFSYCFCHSKSGKTH